MLNWRSWYGSNQKGRFFSPEIFRGQCSACASCWSLEQICQIILFETHTQCYGRLHLVHMIAKWWLMLVQRTVRTVWGLRLHWCCSDFTKKPSQNLKSNVFLNAVFFFWNILALRGINIMFKFLGFRNKKKSFCHRWQVVCKVLSRGKSLFSLVYKRLCLWFKCWWNHTLANTLFIWDGKIADV